jgi:hypothetical protein
VLRSCCASCSSIRRPDIVASCRESRACCDFLNRSIAGTAAAEFLGRSAPTGSRSEGDRESHSTRLGRAWADVHLCDSDERVELDAVPQLVRDTGEFAFHIRIDLCEVVKRQPQSIPYCALREDLLVEVSKPAREGRIDYLLVESTGTTEPLPAAEPRLGRRTVLTFPLLPPPQKN